MGLGIGSQAAGEAFLCTIFQIFGFRLQVFSFFIKRKVISSKEGTYEIGVTRKITTTVLLPLDLLVHTTTWTKAKVRIMCFYYYLYLALLHLAQGHFDNASEPIQIKDGRDGRDRRDTITKGMMIQIQLTLVQILVLHSNLPFEKLVIQNALFCHILISKGRIRCTLYSFVS